MKIYNLDEMKKGWFVGDFEPTIIKTENVEVAVKQYKKDDYEDAHFHKIATELTVVVKGRIRMFDRVFNEGDIILVEPGESTDFLAIEDTICTVVKYPGAKNDKYLVMEG